MGIHEIHGSGNVPSYPIQPPTLQTAQTAAKDLAQQIQSALQTSPGPQQQSQINADLQAILQFAGTYNGDSNISDPELYEITEMARQMKTQIDSMGMSQFFHTYQSMQTRASQNSWATGLQSLQMALQNFSSPSYPFCPDHSGIDYWAVMQNMILGAPNSANDWQYRTQNDPIFCNVFNGVIQSYVQANKGSSDPFVSACSSLLSVSTNTASQSQAGYQARFHAFLYQMVQYLTGNPPAVPMSSSPQQQTQQVLSLYNQINNSLNNYMKGQIGIGLDGSSVASVGAFQTSFTNAMNNLLQSLETLSDDYTANGDSQNAAYINALIGPLQEGMNAVQTNLNAAAASPGNFNPNAILTALGLPPLNSDTYINFNPVPVNLSQALSAIQPTVSNME